MLSLQEGTSFHVLYLEDDEVDIQSVEREVKKLSMPIRLHIAKNGIDALNQLRGQSGEKKLVPTPHLILMDINMPRMNGIEFLTKLRADPELEYIPVYVLTTAFTTPDKIAMQKLHVSNYIVKPLQHDDLIKMYLSWMSGE